MSTIVEGALLGRSRSRSRSRARDEKAPRLLAGGVLWIVVFALVLAGVVAVNVAVLRLNLELDGVSRERTQLRADIADVRSQLSRGDATFQIEKTARDELGLVQADPDQTVFVRLPPK
jgi:cell division protein FtsB